MYKINTQKKHPFSLLILSKKNSARSLMTEAVLSKLAGKYFHVFSAGTEPAGYVEPLAIEQLQLAGYSTENLRSKSVDEFLTPEFQSSADYIMTICNPFSRECPLFGERMIDIHWPCDDPTLVQGSDEEKRAAFARTFTQIQNRINTFMGLALEELDYSFMLGALLAVWNEI